MSASHRGQSLTEVNSRPLFVTNIKYLDPTAADISSQDVLQFRVPVLRCHGMLPIGGNAGIYGSLRCCTIGCETSIIELKNGESCRDHERKFGPTVRAPPMS